MNQPRVPAGSPRGGQWTGKVTYDKYGVDPRAKRSFDEAIKHVQEHYAKELADLPESPSDLAEIKLIKASRMQGTSSREFRGLFLQPGPVITPEGKIARDTSGKALRGRMSIINIRAGRYPTHEFVSTLVHELKHLEQYRIGKPFDETEAYRAGSDAQLKFNLIKGIK